MAVNALGPGLIFTSGVKSFQIWLERCARRSLLSWAAEGGMSGKGGTKRLPYGCAGTEVPGIVTDCRHLEDGSCSKRSDSDTYRPTSEQTSHLRLRRDVSVCLMFN